MEEVKIRSASKGRNWSKWRKKWSKWRKCRSKWMRKVEGEVEARGGNKYRQ